MKREGTDLRKRAAFVAVGAQSVFFPAGAQDSAETAYSYMCDTKSASVVVKLVSGTGQFEGANSQYEFDYTPLVSERNEDGNPGKLIYSFWGEGTIGLIK